MIWKCKRKKKEGGERERGGGGLSFWNLV